jgi:hypothetical protein
LLVGSPQKSPHSKSSLVDHQRKSSPRDYPARRMRRRSAAPTFGASARNRSRESSPNACLRARPFGGCRASARIRRAENKGARRSFRTCRGPRKTSPAPRLSE